MTNGNGGIKMDTAQPLGPSNNTRIVHNLAVYACSAGLAFYLALSVDDIRLSDLADPNVAQVAFTNIVTAASPGDNIDDAAAITVSEAAAEVIAQALRTTAPCFFRFASIAALDVAQFVAFAARKAFRISGVAAEAEAVDAGPAGGESYLRRLSSLERPLIRQVVSPQRLGAALRRRVTVVDLQTELMLWLLFAVLSDGYMTQDHQDWVEALQCGIEAGILAQAYRDLTILALGVSSFDDNPAGAPAGSSPPFSPTLMSVDPKEQSAENPRVEISPELRVLTEAADSPGASIGYMATLEPSGPDRQKQKNERKRKRMNILELRRLRFRSWPNGWAKVYGVKAAQAGTLFWLYDEVLSQAFGAAKPLGELIRDLEDSRVIGDLSFGVPFQGDEITGGRILSFLGSWFTSAG
eukprot:CAMPEP_0172617446 /NCGR_PEP_ID=MMETSP1068-20121228/70257_1 /TAXON_ID=35684 /ORGANISM="Pseudopedinella elastica, Strain CCMP716" /LENGTH=409 /DNA_ID=CAMNT_0013423209 /DNA_START=337 /DNA_END=1566 /DNA_ORIENTATION=-